MVKVNDFDFLNGTISSNITSANELLIPKNRSDTTTFVFRNPSTNEERTVLLKGVVASPSIYDRDIQYTSVLETETGNVGYLHLGKYGVDVRKYHREIEKFKIDKVSDIIVDLRYFDEIEERWEHTRYDATLAFMIVGSRKTKDEYREDVNSYYYSKSQYKSYRSMLRKVNRNIPFQSRYGWLLYRNLQPYARTEYNPDDLEFSDISFKPVVFNSYCPGKRRRGMASDWFCLTFGGWEWETWSWHFLGFWDLIIFETLNLDKVYIIASEHSCNRAEMFINALRGVDVDIILIGEKTCGSSYRRSYLTNCGISIELIGGRYYNEKFFTSYDEGFRPANSKSKTGISIPGCYVEDDLGKPIGDLEEPMLKAALQYRKDKTCP